MQEEECRESIGAVIPQLCRLTLHLSARETQGARPPGSIWEVLLRCADVRVSPEEENGDGESGRSTCVQVRAWCVGFRVVVVVVVIIVMAMLMTMVMMMMMMAFGAAW